MPTSFWTSGNDSLNLRNYKPKQFAMDLYIKNTIKLITLFAFISCQAPMQRETTETEKTEAEDIEDMAIPEPEERQAEQDVVPEGTPEILHIEGMADMHNARLALDYLGKYKGVLPCADCEGIETTLEIKEEKRFLLQWIYLGKHNEENRFELSGKWRWEEDGNTITLIGVDPPNQYWVREGSLVRLDIEGMRITGDLAEKYALQKVGF